MVDISNITDIEIRNLYFNPKKILEKEKTKEYLKFKRRNIKLKDTENNFYQIYLRQNLINKNDFSCGLSLILEDKTYFTLIRCNGNSHIHNNTLEKSKLEYCFHIHLTTEKYIQKSKKQDGFAEETKRYRDIEGAYQYLIKKCNIADDNFKNNLFGIDIWI